MNIIFFAINLLEYLISLIRNIVEYSLDKLVKNGFKGIAQSDTILRLNHVEDVTFLLYFKIKFTAFFQDQ